MPESPTPGQAETLIAFIAASRACKGTQGTESEGNGKITRYALCLSATIPEKLEAVRKWARENPEEFKLLHNQLKEAIRKRDKDFRTRIAKAITTKLASVEG